MSLGNLTKVCLSGNSLSGNVPSDFLRNVDVETFKYAFLGSNNIVGTLPGNSARLLADSFFWRITLLPASVMIYAMKILKETLPLLAAPLFCVRLELLIQRVGKIQEKIFVNHVWQSNMWIPPSVCLLVIRRRQHSYRFRSRP